MSEHTQEPWEYVAWMDDMKMAQIETADETAHSFFIDPGGPLEGEEGGLRTFTKVELEANARRIAACWNACAGIPTAALESGAVADLVASLEGLFEHCSMIHKHWGENCNAREANAVIEAARAVIDKVTP